jgi:hypothetical protein
MKDSSTNDHNKNRRRRKFIWPELQLRLAIQALFITLPILLLNFVLLYTDALNYQRTLVPPADAAVVQMLGVIFHDFLISLVIAVPFTIGVGILYSFPFCGPIYRFNKFLADLTHGRWDGQCTLRDGDRLQELKNNLNNALQLMAGRVYMQHELLQEARAILEDSSTTVADQEKLRNLIKGIESNSAEVAQRFGENGGSPVDREERSPVQSGDTVTSP